MAAARSALLEDLVALAGEVCRQCVAGGAPRTAGGFLARLVVAGADGPSEDP